jgi:hypothetical protein
MMAYLPQTNEALNPWIGRLNSNHDKDSVHHWSPDAVVIRDRKKKSYFIFTIMTWPTNEG